MWSPLQHLYISMPGKAMQWVGRIFLGNIQTQTKNLILLGVTEDIKLCLNEKGEDRVERQWFYIIVVKMFLLLQISQ